MANQTERATEEFLDSLQELFNNFVESHELQTYGGMMGFCDDLQLPYTVCTHHDDTLENDLATEKSMREAINRYFSQWGTYVLMLTEE